MWDVDNTFGDECTNQRKWVMSCPTKVGESIK